MILFICIACMLDILRRSYMLNIIESFCAPAFQPSSPAQPRQKTLGTLKFWQWSSETPTSHNISPKIEKKLFHKAWEYNFNSPQRLRMRPVVHFRDLTVDTGTEGNGFRMVWIHRFIFSIFCLDHSTVRRYNDFLSVARWHNSLFGRRNPKNVRRRVKSLKRPENYKRLLPRKVCFTLANNMDMPTT